MIAATASANDTSPDAAPRGRWSAPDGIIALAAGAVALVLYVATLQPDLGGPEDTPKFQFLGYVLGTAHPPGYPLYVLLSHLFVQLPIRTIAYRANLFSAVMAALACGLTYVLGREIGATRWMAFCAALGLATGAGFWRGAVFAEVYSLAAVVSAAGTALLLAWGARGGAGRLLAAVAVLSLGLGNHLTIVGVVPAFAIYVLLRDRRALTARVLAGAAVILLLGVSQYGFIVLRTRQGASFLESQARSLPELVSVVTAERFASERFAFGPTALVTVQIPTVALVVGSELGIAGLVGLAAGLIAAVRTRNAGAMVIIGAAAGMFAMVINLSGDVYGFITPVMVLIWPLAGLGLSAIFLSWRPASAGPLQASERGGIVLRHGVRVLAVAAAAAMPLANLAANYKEADRSGGTAEARFLRSLHRQLPDHAAIVAENYGYDMLLQYLRLTGEAGPDRGIAPIEFAADAVQKAARDGRRVFAFAGAATFFGAEGLRFARTPLAGPSLDEWVRALPRGTVIVAAAAYTPVPLELSGIDRRDPRGLGQPRSFSAFVRMVGEPDVARAAGHAAISLAVEPGMLNARLPVFPGTVRSSADERGARLELAGRTIAHAATGLAIAVFSPDGALARAFTLQRDQLLRVPFEEALYELEGENACGDVGTDRWSDVTPALATGSWVATLPANGSVVIDTAIADSRGLRSRASILLGSGAAREIDRAPGADGTDVLSTELTRTPGGRPVFRLAFDRPVVAARARLKPGGARSSVRVCAQEMFPLFADGASQAVLRPDFESEAYFGPGWGDVEQTATGRVRRGADRATLLLPLRRGYDYRVFLDLAGATGTRIDIAFNNDAIGACALGSGVPCEVALPRGAVRDGTNTLTLAPQGSSPITFQSAQVLRQAVNGSFHGR